MSSSEDEKLACSAEPGLIYSSQAGAELYWIKTDRIATKLTENITNIIIHSCDIFSCILCDINNELKMMLIFVNPFSREL